MSYKASKVESSGTIKDALLCLNRSGLEIALVVDSSDRLKGILTDGDIRRAILDGACLDSPLASYVITNYTFVGEQTSRTEVLDLMQARGIGQIPVLDEDKKLVGLHTIRAILGGVERPNWAVIMAGGRGERLRPITDTIPKPMLKVAGRPIIERIVLHLVGFGIRRIFLSINYLGEKIERHFGDGSAFGCSIDYMREDRPLGTGGALSLLPETPKEPVLVLNGDLVTQFDVGRMLAFHEAKGNVISIGVHQYVHTVPYGVVELKDGRVSGLREKPAESWLVNAGIYVIEPRLIGRIPRGQEYPLPGLIEESLDKEEPVGAFLIKDDWVDVGLHQELKRARGED